MKTTKEMIAVMQAYEDGKEIELVPNCYTDKIWKDTSNPTWDWHQFDYRVKQAPEYVPFTFEDAEFLIGKTVRCKSQDYVALIISVTKDGTSVDDFKPLLDDFTFLDGSPCGKLKQ